MVFGRNFCENDKFGYLNPILGMLGVTHDVGWWLVGKSIVDFLFVLIERLRYLLRYQSYEAKCVQLCCFHSRVDLLALKFYVDRVVPNQPFLASEN